MIIQRKAESDWKASAWQIYDDHRERSTKKHATRKGRIVMLVMTSTNYFFLHFTIVLHARGK